MSTKGKIYLPIYYNVTLRALDDFGKVHKEVKARNTVCHPGLVLLANMLRDYNDGTDWDTGLTYIAIGTGATTPLKTDTKLTTEVKRESIITKDLNDNVLGVSTYFPKADCTYFIKETGAFGHSTATAAVDTGQLMMHSLVSYDNTSGIYNVTVDIEFTLGTW